MAMARRKPTDINEIILHCSDSDNLAHDDISVIRKWHVDERGFDDVGYHYFIKFEGQVQKGRDLSYAGSHCQNHNKNSIGICLHGKLAFTTEQYRALRLLIGELEARFTISRIVGHHFHQPAKTCPNFSVKDFLDGKLG